LTSPPGRLLVVSANLRKALPRYLADDSSLVNFTRRVRRVVPDAPDALLLQEVVSSSAFRVAELLSEELGFDYHVAIAPGESAVVGHWEGQDVVRNAAILLNAATLRVEGAGGYLATRYASRDARPGVRPRVKEHPHCLAVTPEGDLAAALVSVHLVTNDKFTLPRVGFRHKGRWARELATFVRAAYPGDRRSRLWVLGGDFNNRRCRRWRETVRCRELPFWDALVRHEGYRDAVFERHGGLSTSLAEQARSGRHVLKRIDYLFVRGRVYDASHDVGYDARSGDADFYSDHRMLWAVVGPEPGPGA
jgi:hypothetical protein